MDLLANAPQRPAAFKEWQMTWYPAFNEAMKIQRHITDTEYEAFMDMVHDLPLTAKFKNGKKSLFQHDVESLKKFGRTLRQTEIVEVQYLPEALKKLGGLYLRSCELLGRSGCEVYKNYRGFRDPEVRPFTQQEEQALKWCTFHMASQISMVATLKAARREGQSEETITRIHFGAAEARRAAGRELTVSTFNAEDGHKIYSQIVWPYITASFERTYELYKGKSMQ